MTHGTDLHVITDIEIFPSPHVVDIAYVREPEARSR